MKSIYSLYKPQDNPALLHPRSDRSVGFYYLPKGEADKTKAIAFDRLSIYGKKIGKKPC